MFSKIITFGTILAAASASLSSHGHGHGQIGQALSYQNFIRQDEPLRYTTRVAQYAAPAAHYATPIAEYAAPAAQHATPIAEYAAPSAQHATPIAEYEAPVAQYAAPIAQYENHGDQYDAAPVAQYAAPAAQYTANYDNGHDTYAKYEFSYSVADPHTGDYKSQHESRDGDVVHGYYTLAQPDGTVRKVEYTADGHRGFNAVVHTSGKSVHPTPAHEYASHH